MAQKCKSGFKEIASNELPDDALQAPEGDSNDTFSLEIRAAHILASVSLD
jgi:hypothetical protein